MAVRRVAKYGEKILKKKTRPVDFAREKVEIKKIVNDMFETMVFAGGMGLSANQVGLDMRVTVIREKRPDGEFDDYILVNPEITGKKGEQTGEEGCLSFPGLFVEVKRYGEVKVKAMNGEGIPVQISAEGLLARALQHEIDHLDGITFVERLPFVKRMKLRPILSNLKKEWSRIDESADAVMADESAAASKKSEEKK